MYPGEIFDCHGTISTDLNHQTCRDFMRGVCQRGIKCRFHHPVLNTISFCAGSIPICRDFQNGQCARKFCKYAHFDRSSQKTLINKQIPGSNVHSILNVNDPANSQQNFGNDNYVVHSGSPAYTGISGGVLQYYPNFNLPIDSASYVVNSPPVSSNYEYRSPYLVNTDQAFRKLHQENIYLRQQNNFLMNKLYQYEMISQSRENSLPDASSLSFPFPEASVNTSDEVSYNTANIFDSAFTFNKDSMSLYPFHKMLKPSDPNFASSMSLNCGSSFDTDDLSSFTTPDYLYPGNGNEAAFRESFENATKIARHSNDHKLANVTRFSPLGTAKSQGKSLSEEKFDSSIGKASTNLKFETIDDDISQMINPTINEFLNVSNLQ